MDDRWIDAVAREMTEGWAPDDLRARVLARIAARDVRTSWPLAVRLALAGVVLVAATALTAMMWPERPQEAESLVRSEPTVSPLGGTNAEAPPAPDASVVSQPALSPTPPPRAASESISARVVASAGTTALAPDDLTVPAMDLDAIGSEDAPMLGALDVAPLNITRLEIEPIGFQGDLQ